MVQVATYFESDIRGILTDVCFRKVHPDQKYWWECKCVFQICVWFLGWWEPKFQDATFQQTNIFLDDLSLRKSVAKGEEILRKKFQPIFAQHRQATTQKNGFVKSSRHARVVEASSHEIADKSSLSRQSNKNYRFRNKRVGDG